MDNPSWSIYAPSRTKDVDIADANVYFNNLGELFINRPLRAGDWYTLDIDRLTVGELEIEQALADCEGADDPAYAAALVLNRDLPLGIDSALYQQTYEIIAGAETPYQRASAICDWLKLRGEYTLTPEPCGGTRHGVLFCAGSAGGVLRVFRVGHGGYGAHCRASGGAMWRAIWPFRTKTVNAS